MLAHRRRPGIMLIEGNLAGLDEREPDDRAAEHALAIQLIAPGCELDIPDKRVPRLIERHGGPGQGPRSRQVDVEITAILRSTGDEESARRGAVDGQRD